MLDSEEEGYVTIGEMAKSAGVGVETVRFYEREGLLPEPPRRPSGYRQYSLEAVHRLQFIRRTKELGFSLGEIRELLELRVNPRMSCAEVKQRAEAKIAGIEKKLAELQRMKKALGRLASACSGRGPTSTCPILDAMEGGRAAH